MAVRNARKAGFENISLDLIYGLPSQTKADWAETLERAVELRPEHLSCYGLQLEEDTPLYRNYHDSPLLPDADTQADMYMYTIEMLRQNGYRQYEISNFSIPGYESKHNLRYWQMKDYMGFGPSAASCVGNIRYSYIKDLKAYLSGIAGSKSIVEEYEEISPMEKASEYIMLGLRTTHGIKKSEYSNIYLSEWEPIENLLKEFESKGWAVCEDERWSLTPSGFLISNQLIGAVLDAQAAERAQTSPWMRDTLKDVEPVVLPAGEEEQFSAYIEELLR